MPKERNYNPVQAQRKADKAKAIKKGIFRRFAIGALRSANTLLPQAKQSSKGGATRNSRSAIPTASRSRSMISRR